MYWDYYCFFRLILLHFNMTVYVLDVCVMCALCFVNVLLWTSSLSINMNVICWLNFELATKSIFELRG